MSNSLTKSFNVRLSYIQRRIFLMTTERGQDPQDSHPEGKAPVGEAGTPPAEPETFTKAQLDEAVSKAVQKARIDTGRESKAKHDDALSKALKGKDDQITELTRRIDEIDNEKYRDDPEGLKTMQEKRNLRQERAQLESDRQALETEKEAHAERLQKADEQEVEMRIITSAVNHHLDIETLKEKCKRLGLTTEEAIEEIAETIGTAKPPETPPGGNPPLHVDSGKGLGGSTTLTAEQIDKMSPEEYANHPSVKERFKVK
jgi:myosin heavy subunit